MQVPDSSKCVANECRNQWQVARFGIEALREAAGGKWEIALLWAGFAGAAAAVFAFRHEAEGAVERAVGAEIRIAAHPIGEAKIHAARSRLLFFEA